MIHNIQFLFGSEVIPNVMIMNLATRLIRVFYSNSDNNCISTT